MIKKIIEFITRGVWQKKESEISNPKVRWALRPFKIILYTARGIGKHNVIVRSAAMTFYTLMTIVPIAALIFAIVKGFGLETNLSEYLYMQFPQYSAVIDNILDFADNLLQKTRGGIIASFGLVVLLWAVMRLFGNMERAFNDIWEVKKRRSFARKFSDYITVIFLAPLLWILSNSIMIYLRTSLSPYSYSWLLDIVFGLASLVAIWLMFAFIYYVLPNTKVKLKGAVTAGIVAGTIFQIYQIIYVWIQSSVSSYNAIYGSFAALPLFLIWLQASWQILLFGAELSFAYQNIGQYEQELKSMHMNADNRRKVLLAVMVTVIRHFNRNDGPVYSEGIAHELNLPVRIVRDVVFELEESGLVASIKYDADDKVNMYIPAKDVHCMRISDVIDTVEQRGSTNIKVNDMEEIRKISAALDNIKISVNESPLNLYLKDLIED